MGSIRLRAVFDVPEGRLEEFKAIAQALLAGVREKDPGTLAYDWYLDEKSGRCVVHEHYADSAAGIAHLQNAGALLGQLAGTVTVVAVEAYGDPTPEARAAFDRIRATWLPGFLALGA